MVRPTLICPCTGAAVVIGWMIAAASGALAAGPDCTPLDLPVERVVEAPTQYVEFCVRHPAACVMSGPSEVPYTPALRRVLAEVNAAVNAEVRFIPDIEWRGEEEHWDFPLAGCGDCEDFALEKRERLAARGVPRAAMTMAIVHHRTEMFPHVVLLVATTQGTLALDNLHDNILCWNAIPFNYEARERPDGLWTRFDQQAWTSGPP